MLCLGRCPKCQAWTETPFSPGGAHAECGSCKSALWPHAADNFLEKEHLSQCPYCGCQHIYRQKDFNRKLGVGLLVVGIALAYFTYGISLLIVTIVDWLLYRKVGDVGCCYLCQAQFRNSMEVSTLAPFDLILFDHYRAKRES